MRISQDEESFSEGSGEFILRRAGGRSVATGITFCMCSITSEFVQTIPRNLVPSPRVMSLNLKSESSLGNCACASLLDLSICRERKFFEQLGQIGIMGSFVIENLGG